MFGNRFFSSLTRSALAAAGVASVLLSPGALLAQGYQHTTAPRFAKTELPSLSSQATQPPAFSDTAIESVAMSPNGWSESAINNPYAGYERTASSAPTPTPASTPASPARYTSTPSHTRVASMPAGMNNQYSGATTFNDGPRKTGTPRSFLPATQHLQRLALANDAASDETTTPVDESDPTYSIMTPLTNTDYTRVENPPTPATDPAAQPLSDRYANRSFGGVQIPELTPPPRLPKVQFPFTRKQATRALDQIPLAPNVSTNRPTPRVDFSTLNQPDINRPRIDFSATTPRATSSAIGRTDGPTFPRQSAQPVFSQPSTPANPPMTTPRTSAPAATFQPSPHYAHQSSGPISNQWGFGYPESGQWQTQPHVETPYNIFDHGYDVTTQPTNVGQRSAYPTTRNHTILDSGEAFDHEGKKKEFPPFGEIIATGRFFGSLDLAFLRPHFLGNTAISIDGPAFSESIPFEFDNETAPHVRFGFESKYGPGFELNYFTLNANSNPISETFNGVAPITTIASITGPNRFTQLSADAIGETLNVNHSFEIETISFNVFKEIQFKVSRLNGQFGFTYANIAQSLEASITDGGDTILDTLQSTSDFRGFGPKFGIEYYRPLGHTPLEFITSFTGTGLFGRRDQFVSNTTDLVQRRFGADEFVTVLDFTSGIQYKKTIAENRSWFARVAFVHQSWLGGGTAVDPQGDFGLKGFTFGVGYNR